MPTGNEIVKKTILVILVMIPLVPALLWGAYHIFFPSGHWHYRMTVVLNTPEGVRTNSVVRRVSYHKEPKILPEQAPAIFSVTGGTANFFDLGERGVLFAIMRGGLADGDYEWVIALDSFPELRRFKEAPKNVKVVLKQEQYPTFLWFKDVKDPTSVENVFDVNFYSARDNNNKYVGSEARISNRLEQVLGQGAFIQEISVEITDAPVTGDIESLLPSIGRGQKYTEWLQKRTHGDPLRFSRHDLIRGDR